MATNDIVEKLNKVITGSDAFLHEKDVVYFFVQIRKLMEREGIFNNYRGIKFYCDWVLHPQKDKHHDEIDSIYSGIYLYCVNDINEAGNDESDSILPLLQFSNLKNDLRPLFERYNF